MNRCFFVLALAGGVAAAQADTITATYSCTTNPGAQVFGTVGANNYAEWGTMINGLRQDLPAGAGVNSDIPLSFPTFCVELGEDVNVGFGPAGTAGPSSYTHTVLPLLGSTTAAGGLSGPVFFDATRTDNMQRLWGTFYVDATAQSSLQFQQAFQIAVWEIAFDTDLNLSTGNNVITATADAAVLPLAQSWLNLVASGGGSSQSLYLLNLGGVQDLITPVPTPGSAALMGLGMLASSRRRRA